VCQTINKILLLLLILLCVNSIMCEEQCWWSVEVHCSHCVVGDHCESTTDLCQSMPCGVNGTCESYTNGTYRCTSFYCFILRQFLTKVIQKSTCQPFVSFIHVFVTVFVFNNFFPCDIAWPCIPFAVVNFGGVSFVSLW